MKINQLKAGSLLSYASMVLGYIISLVYTPLMLRLLGQSEYGLYNLVMSVVSYLGLLNFGLGSAYVRFYLRYKVKEEKKEIENLNGMFLIMYSIIGLIAVAAGLVLANNVELVFGNELSNQELETARTLLFILSVNLAITFPNIVFNSYITANEQFIFQKIMEGIRIILNPLIILPALLLGYGSIGMALATTIVSTILELSNIFFSRKKLKMRFNFKGFNKKLLKEIVIFSWFIFLTLIVREINWNVDKYILGRVSGTIAVAIYGLAAQLRIYYNSLSTAIYQVFIPRVNRIVSKGNSDEELTDLFIKVGRIQFLILSLITSGFIFFGKPFLNMWAGSEYSQSYYVALLMFLPLLIPSIQNVGVEIQKAKNMHQFRSYTYFAIAIFNVMLTIPLAQRWGSIGAASSTTISLLIGHGLLMNWYYHKKIGLDIILFWKKIGEFTIAFIPPIITGILLMNFVDLYSVSYFTLSGIVYVSVFTISFWIMGLNDFEKNLIVIPLKRGKRLIKNKIDKK